MNVSVLKGFYALQKFLKIFDVALTTVHVNCNVWEHSQILSAVKLLLLLAFAQWEQGVVNHPNHILVY